MKKITILLILNLTLFIFFGQIQAQETLKVKRLIEISRLNGTKDTPNQYLMIKGKELSKYIIDWVLEGKLTPYEPSRNFADFSQKRSLTEFKSNFSYFDPMFGDSIQLTPEDYRYLLIEEEVKYQNATFQYEIKSLTLKTDGVADNAITLAAFRYEDLLKLWESTYQASRKMGRFDALECFIAPYDDNTKTISLAEAFEKRYFQAKVLEVQPKDKASILENEKKYQPQKASYEGLAVPPNFMQTSEKELTTSIREEINLKNEQGFFQENNQLVAAIVQGLKAGHLSRVSNYDNSLNYLKNQEYLAPEGIMAALSSKTDEYLGLESTPYTITELFKIELHSKVNIRKGKIIYQPLEVTLILPRKYPYEYAVEVASESDEMLLTIDYEELKTYFQQIFKEKKIGYKAGKKLIAFDKAIEKRLFSAHIVRYDNAKGFFPYFSIIEPGVNWERKISEYTQVLRLYFQQLANQQ